MKLPGDTPQLQDNARSIKFFDLFCGGGGSSLGAKQAGAIPIAGLDVLPVACKAYELNLKPARACCCDVRDFDPAAIVRNHGPVDLLLASPECVAHSLARGKRLGSEESKSLAFEVIRFARIMSPRWLVVENVPQMRYWSRFSSWCRTLEELGYKLLICNLKAYEFGVPQTRSGLFVIGDRFRKPVYPRRYKKLSAVASCIIGSV